MTDSAYWKAVLGRDSRMDGRFVYAVRSTGIYCRPTCPSRRPKRENVAFFADREEAEGAGFRACRRCRPERAGADAQAELIREICAHLERNERVSLTELGREFGLSPFHLQRTFRAAMGVSPAAYAAALRAGRLKENLRNGSPVTHAAYDAGYGSPSHIYETAELGMTPREYGNKGAGLRIAFACAPSPVGRVLVAATEQGVCAVALGDTDRELEAGLRQEFAAAEIVRGDQAIQPWIQSVLKAIDGSAPDPRLPFSVRGTAFQKRIWDYLRTIPRGETKTYTDVAREIGQPTAARAVARACAANPVAVLVPCHRVVKQDGNLAGYRWGVERKKKLLAREKGQASG